VFKLKRNLNRGPMKPASGEVLYFSTVDFLLQFFLVKIWLKAHERTIH
jgi:hypothetical protein